MKDFKKKAFGYFLAFSVILGATLAFVPNETHAQADDDELKEKDGTAEPGWLACAVQPYPTCYEIHADENGPAMKITGQPFAY